MFPNQFTPYDPEALQLENEFRKMELEREFGAFIGPTNPDLPPEIENLFLRHVLDFERQFKNAGTVTLYEYLGRPRYRRPEELRTEQECAAELTRLLDLMREQGVTVSIHVDHKPRELYRWVVEELLTSERSSLRMPGLMSHYVIEE